MTIPPVFPTAKLSRNPSPIAMDASTTRPRVRFAARVTYPPPRPLDRALRFTPAAGGEVPDGAFHVVQDAVSDSSPSASLMLGGYREPILGSPPVSLIVGGYCESIPGSPPASLMFDRYSEPIPGSPPASFIVGGYCESVPGSPPTSRLVGGAGESITGPSSASLIFARYSEPIPGPPPASLLVGGTCESIPGPPPASLMFGSYREPIPGFPPASLLGGGTGESIPRPPRVAPTSLSLRTGQPHLTVPPPSHSPIANTPRPPLRTPFPQLSLFSPPPPASFPSYLAALPIPIAPSPPAILRPSNFDYFSPSPSYAIFPPASQRHQPPPRFSPPPNASHPRWEFLCSACRVHGRGAGRERCCLMRGERGWAGDGEGGSEESGDGETGRWEGWGGLGGRGSRGW